MTQTTNDIIIGSLVCITNPFRADDVRRGIVVNIRRRMGQGGYADVFEIMTSEGVKDYLSTGWIIHKLEEVET